MIEAVKLTLYQDMVNYKTPVSFQLRESYPLPPYSTVIGMVHNACGYTSYVPMAVSVRGRHFSRVLDYQVVYYFHPTMKYEEARHQYRLDLRDSEKSLGVTRSTVQTELLTDVELMLHVRPLDPARFPEISAALSRPPEYLSLGRREDLVRIDRVKRVTCRERELEDDVELGGDAYVPVDPETDGPREGTIYPLNVVSRVDEKGFRRWTRQETVYASGGTRFFAGDRVIEDDDGDLVFFVEGKQKP